MERKTVTPYLYLLGTFFLWGSLYVVSKFVVGRLPVFTTAFLRFVIAFVTLSVVLRLKYPNGLPAIRAEHRKHILLLGFLGYTVAVGAQLIGIKRIGASLASLINALNPVTMTIAGALLLGERLTKRKVIGVLIALAGVYVIVGAGGTLDALGVALSLFAVVGWSFVSVMTRKALRQYDPLIVTWAALSVAVVCNIPMGVGQLIREWQSVSLGAAGVAGLVYMGALCTGLAYMLWNKSLSMLEAGTCSAFYPIQPLTSTVLGALFLGESVGVSFFIGAVLIISGVLVSLTHGAEASGR